MQDTAGPETVIGYYVDTNLFCPKCIAEGKPEGEGPRVGISRLELEETFREAGCWCYSCAATITAPEVKGTNDVYSF